MTTSRPSVTAALVALLIGLFCLLLLFFISQLLGASGVQPGGWAYAFDALFQAVVFAGPAFFYYLRNPKERPSLRFQPIDPLSIVLISLAALVGTFALSWLSTYWMQALTALGYSGGAQTSAVPRTEAQLWMMLVVFAIVPALFEELLFRGFLFPAFESLGRKRAIFYSGLMFAMLHGRVDVLPTHLLLGTMLALLVLATESLFAAMLYHATHNAAVMLLGFATLMLSQQPVESSLTRPPAFLPGFVLFIGWLSLLFFAIEHGAKTQASPLPRAEATPLSFSAKALLIISFTLLALLQVGSAFSLLPGGGL